MALPGAAQKHDWHSVYGAEKRGFRHTASASMRPPDSRTLSTALLSAASKRGDHIQCIARIGVRAQAQRAIEKNLAEACHTGRQMRIVRRTGFPFEQLPICEYSRLLQSDSSATEPCTSAL